MWKNGFLILTAALLVLFAVCGAKREPAPVLEEIAPEPSMGLELEESGDNMSPAPELEASGPEAEEAVDLQEETQETSGQSENPGLDFVIMEPVIMGESGRISLKSGEEVYLYLELVSGQYFYGTGTVHERRWTGEYQLSVYTSPGRYEEGRLYTLPVSAVGYNHYFEILVDDYNQDGNPDFVIAVGSVASSAKYFRMYTIEADYTIREIDMGRSREDGFSVMTNRDSIRLIQEDGKIEIYFINNHTDSISYVSYYKWDGEMFALVETQEAIDPWLPYEEHKAIFEEKRALMYE